MSGTSMDGVDLAYCEFEELNNTWHFKIVHAETIPYPEVWITRLTKLHEQPIFLYPKTDAFYGKYLGQLVNDFIKKNNLKVDLISSHGHTIFHQPENGFTAQIGDGASIHAETNEASIGLTVDEQTLLIYKDVNGGDIYYSALEGKDWNVPQPMGSDINTPNWETSACLTPDGKTLYFVSNRKEGSLGGRDIWKCIKLPTGQWSSAQNLGAPINTEYDEESPFINPSGNVLFFSSKGHKSIGGFDIFFSTKGEKGWV